MRDSLRIFRTQPAFAASVIAVLALCVGANCALFSVVNGLMLRPLPFPESGRLVVVSSPGHKAHLEEVQRARSIALAGEFTPWNYAVPGSDGIRMAYTLRTTADAIPLLQLRPFLGRALTSSDFDARVLMLGYDYWKALGSPRDIVSRTLLLDDEPYAVVGVLAPDFFLTVRDAKLIVPNLHATGLTIARLQPGITPQQAQAEINTLIPGTRVEFTPFGRAFYSNDYRPVILLLATAGFVLLITCANVTNLQLVRGFARQREFAIRAAIGASRLRLILHCVAETIPLGIAGAALGLWLTRILHDAILLILPANISRHLSGADALELDARVLAFTAFLAITTIILFGLLPALGTLRFDIIAQLRGTGYNSHRGRRFGQALVASEVALALMLLSGAGLTLKNLLRIDHQYLGFQSNGVVRALADFPERHFPTPARKLALVDELERRIGALPGVTTVGMVAPQAFPFGGPMVPGARFEIFGSPDTEARAEVYSANPAYLDAIRIPLLQGRWFTPADTASTVPVAVLSESVARKYWPKGDCLGRRVLLNRDRPDNEWTTIIGIVGDVKNPVSDHWQPNAYRPLAQTPAISGLLIRTAAVDPQTLAPTISRELRAIDPAAPDLHLVTRLNDAIYSYAAPQRFTTTLLIIFAAVGLALAAAGVYGVMGYWVASRTAEIGIRVALGAQRAHVRALVLGRASAPAAIGVAAGIAGAIALRQVIATQLIGISAVDPLILSAVALMLLLISLLAAWLPARRATRIQPVEALRTD